MQQTRVPWELLASWWEKFSRVKFSGVGFASRTPINSPGLETYSDTVENLTLRNELGREVGK